MPELENNSFIILLILYLVLLIGAAVYFIILTNRRNKEKISTLRNDWTNKLHQDIGGDLSSVKLRLGILERKLKKISPERSEDITKMYQVLESIEKKFRFIFDLIDNRKSGLQVMLEDIIAFAQENMETLGVAFHVTNELPDKMAQDIDIVRINKLYLAIKEIVNNCLKYAEAKHFYLNISQTKRGLQVETRDDGIGFDAAVQQNGSGLKNLRQYSEEGAINIQIVSGIGQGTITTMTVLF